MPKLLTPPQIDRFREEGFLAPIRVMPAAACEYRRRLERLEAAGLASYYDPCGVGLR